MSLRLSGRNPLSYLGVEPTQPPDLVAINRAPISGAVSNADYKSFNIGTFWLNPLTYDLYYLASKQENIPTWIQLSSGSGNLLQLTGNDGTAVIPVAGNINLRTANATVFFTSGGNPNDNLDFGKTNLILGSNPTATITAASQNVGLGENSLAALTSGLSNACVGYLSGNAINSGSANTLIGFAAGENMTTGDNNTVIGSGALENVTTGSENIVIGQGAGSACTAGTESSNIIIGSIGANGLDNAIVIGTPGSGAGEQDVCYIAGIYGNSPASAQVVIVNASGQLGSQAVSSGGNSILSIAANSELATNSSTVPSYLPFFSSSITVPLANGTESVVQMSMPMAGTISRLYVHITNNASTTTSTIALRVNGVTSALTVSIPATTTGVFSDLTHSVSVNAGDLVNLILSGFTITSPGTYLDGGLTCKLNA